MVGMGGERLSSQYARRFLERHPDIPLYNFYGPVECTAVATSHRVRMKDCAPRPSGTAWPGPQQHGRPRPE
jgi:non-ribosomal peptide synthetase component F